MSCAWTIDPVGGKVDCEEEARAGGSDGKWRGLTTAGVRALRLSRTKGPFVQACRVLFIQRI
jgi:hypothetical protein